ncbi:hypothetical protein OVA24_21205 [Luteolibacter sp. SL250]|uniref:hypothetical protein n=1 Tax=Luteolibacter sp. SL250 TaxID=2995170 RepID=UPI00226E2E5D|nr:hypothetical protein [Luteolibacter sp. SL250]WAC19740.1 hypothetical protein OVA24_21205 [Luteolibacter sp. SL250]
MIRHLAILSALVAPLYAAEIEVAGLKFKAADGWKAAEEARPMSAGSLVKEGEPKLEAIFYHFPGGQGGSVEANLARWQGQFAPEPAPTLEKETVKAGEKEIVIATITGTYKGSTMRPEPVPLENHVTLAAIVPGPQGNVFIRLNAPKDAAGKVKAEFKALAASPYPAK